MKLLHYKHKTMFHVSKLTVGALLGDFVGLVDGEVYIKIYKSGRSAKISMWKQNNINNIDHDKYKTYSWRA